MDLDQLVVLSGVIGSGLPPLIAVLNQSHWPSWGRTLATVLVCAVVGTVTALVNGQLSGLSWPAAVAACAFGTVLAYEKVWKPLAQKIEMATSRKGGLGGPAA